MNCLNCDQFVGDAVDSVYAQTYDDWEIVFWDNASTDSSAEVIRSRGDQRLRYFCGDETVPLGRARNLAINQARGRLLAFLDCDDLWLPTKLEKQVPLFDDPEVGLAYCDSVFFDESGKETRLYGIRRNYEGYCFHALMTDYFLSMETVVLRRAALDSLDDWFDERLNMIEDADLFRRIGHDWKLAAVDEPLARWRVHSASWSWMRGDLVASETELTLQRYAEVFPDFDERYGDAARRLRKKAAVGAAKAQVVKGESVAARANLRPYLGSPRIAAYYLSTYVPHSVLRPLIRLLRRISPS